MKKRMRRRQKVSMEGKMFQGYYKTAFTFPTDETLVCCHDVYYVSIIEDDRNEQQQQQIESLCLLEKNQYASIVTFSI